ncbi:hypothetical protein P8C59_007706 [Phyllachora maydis]|uniref:Uncharacterized protein n=1 Tax=Phyllachora maydis TaxID=1825666 RepID=A0AAD9I9A1_9PEZI|nr:hypothetical protein P8C59_007706 [Phyllachora maydis]
MAPALPGFPICLFFSQAHRDTAWPGVSNSLVPNSATYRKAKTRTMRAGEEVGLQPVHAAVAVAQRPPRGVAPLVEQVAEQKPLLCPARSRPATRAPCITGPRTAVGAGHRARSAAQPRRPSR